MDGLVAMVKKTVIQPGNGWEWISLHPAGKRITTRGGDEIRCATPAIDTL